MRYQALIISIEKWPDWVVDSLSQAAVLRSAGAVADGVGDSLVDHQMGAGRRRGAVEDAALGPVSIAQTDDQSAILAEGREKFEKKRERKEEWEKGEWK